MCYVCKHSKGRLLLFDVFSVHRNVNLNATSLRQNIDVTSRKLARQQQHNEAILYHKSPYVIILNCTGIIQHLTLVHYVKTILNLHTHLSFTRPVSPLPTSPPSHPAWPSYNHHASLPYLSHPHPTSPLTTPDLPITNVIPPFHTSLSHSLPTRYLFLCIPTQRFH